MNHDVQKTRVRHLEEPDRLIHLPGRILGCGVIEEPLPFIEIAVEAALAGRRHVDHRGGAGKRDTQSQTAAVGYKTKLGARRVPGQLLDRLGKRFGSAFRQPAIEPFPAEPVEAEHELGVFLRIVPGQIVRQDGAGDSRQFSHNLSHAGRFW